MFDIFKQDVKVGDRVKLSLTTGKEPEGTVLEIGDNFVLLESDDKTKSRYFDKLIGGWEVIFTKPAIIEQPTNAVSIVTPMDAKAEKPSIPNLKIIGKITLPEIKKQENKPLQSQKPKGKFKSNAVLKDFSELEKTLTTEEKQKLLDEAKLEDEKIVSATGVIVKYFADRNFGFIINKFGYEIYFDVRDVKDEALTKTLHLTSVKLQLPVIFTVSKNYKGDKAIAIHKPDTVKHILDKASDLSENDTSTAINFTEQVLSAFPNNTSASKLKKNLQKRSNTSKKTKQHDLNFQKAVKAKNVERNLEEALKYYQIALDNNEKRDSCIKDIGMLYVAMQEPQKALDFIIEHEKELPDDIVSYNYLVNFYSSVKAFDKVIKYVDLLTNEPSIKKDNRKISIYLSQKGFALIQIKNIDEARKVLNKAIQLYPDNTYSIRLLETLDNPNIEEQSQIIAAEFDSFGGGLSKLIKETLDNYDEYAGLTSKTLETRKFTNKTLNELREFIETAGKARPRERANYLLTEAKLMTTLETEQDDKLKYVLARFCNAMALNHISEQSSMDVVRNYYLEVFNLIEEFNFNEPTFAKFLISYISTYQELFSSVSISIDDALSKIFAREEIKQNILNGILSVFIVNANISAKITSRLYLKYKRHSIEFLKTLLEIPADNITQQIFITSWNTAIDKRRRDYARWFAALKAIYNANNLDTVVSLFPDSLSNLNVNWLPQLDISRLTTISTDIYDALNQYLKQTSYRDKERSYNFAKAQINQLIDEIKEKPTKFSYEGFVPLLEKICILLDTSFKAVEIASTPKVNVKILGESSVVSTDGSAQIKISVENSKDSSPIRDINLKIEKSEGVDSPDSAEQADSVDGGENCELQLKATLSEKVIKDKATTINVICSYRIRSQEEAIELKIQLSLRLYSEEDFEAILNPYEELANGGPVLDTKMFYGRNEFIERITKAIIKTNSKQVVIYGQKRCGKSSVLFHLRKALESTNKTFCISFSVGEIYEDNLSAAKLFYTIISRISEELENLEFDGKAIPDFKCPTYKEFVEAPNSADFFRKQIRLFKRTCSVLPEWKDKKLIIMIDEFTYLYAAIKEKKISDGFMKQWKAITQNEDSAYSSVLVGQDVFPMFKDEFPNEFGVTQDERLTYLAKADAIRLIEEPIGKPQSGNRFIGDAIETIIDYTSCNPYYIQIFCARLVSEMNRKKYMQITIADVKEIADSFINGGQALTDDKFDNLLNAGEKYDIQAIPQETTKAVLKKIATNAQNIGYCLREQISIGDKELEDKVLADLVKREVLEEKKALEQKNDSYKIQVKLFQEWLLKH
jgi:tetratricopeptide (TPR) repeat protein